MLKDSLEDAYKKGDTWVDTQSNAIYGQVDWHETEAATLTAGLRITDEDRTTEDALKLLNNGSAGALNPVSVNKLYPVALGGFASLANGNLDITNSTEQLSLHLAPLTIASLLHKKHKLPLQKRFAPLA